ncbi:MAG: hypothetical protein ACR2LN_04650 [Candidatus Levyibacteriota bacterium]
MYKKILLMTPIAATLFMSAALPVYANPIPQFGSCVNPQWAQTQVNYGDSHGVVGVNKFPGVDSIYSSNGNTMQCLCTNTGEGYQTNWLKASNYSHDQIESLQAQGWIYISEAEAKDSWGLESGPYLAKNETYACTACTPTPTVTPTGTLTPTPTVTTPGPTATPGPGATATPETKVQGASANNNNVLASTGNALVIYVSLLAGAVSLILGLFLKKFGK